MNKALNLNHIKTLIQPLLALLGKKVNRSALAKVATSGQYNDLVGLPDNPEAPDDVVLFGTTQSLTEAQKAQARTNIGAGTSSFNGAYSSLTGAPTIYSDVVRYDAAQSLAISQQETARNNIGFQQPNWAATTGVAHIRNRICYKDVIDTLLTTGLGATNTSVGDLWIYEGNAGALISEMSGNYDYYIKTENIVGTVSSVGWVESRGANACGNCSLITDEVAQAIGLTKVQDESVYSDTGETFCLIQMMSGIARKWCCVSTVEGYNVGNVYRRTIDLKQLDAELLPDGVPVVPVTTDDNGKILAVVDGAFKLVTLSELQS